MSNPDRDLVLPTNLDPSLALQLAMLDDATAEWRGELKQLDVTEEAIVWRAYPNGHSIGALLLHLADCESYWIEEVGAGRGFSPADEAIRETRESDQYVFEWAEAPLKPLSWYLEILDRVRAKTKSTVAELGDPMHTSVSLSGKSCSLRWILSHAVQHEAYHGGQAVLLAVEFAKMDGK